MDGSKRLVASLAMGVTGALARGVRPLGLVGAAGVVLLVAGAASADVKTVAAHYVVVSKDSTALRCGDGPIYYPVRMLKAGDLLRVDGEGGGWVRAEYPSGTKAYVKTDDASFDTTTKVVKLVRASSMMAANEQGARPWWPLLSKDIVAGTTLGQGEPVKSADGVTEGYLVPAPSLARGYVRAEQVRAATAEESAKLAPGATPVTTAVPVTTAAPATAAAPATTTTPVAPATPATPATTETAATPTEPAAPAQQPAAMKQPPSTQQPASNPAEIVQVNPAGEASTPAPAATPEAPEAAPAAAAAPMKPEITKPIGDINTLREMYDRVMQHSEDQAEVQTVISEFNRKIDSLSTTGEDGKIRTALELRRDALKAREQIIESRRALAASSISDERMRSIKLAVEQADRQAIYTIVGRILPSTVYDGKRGMAMMYRIESADASSSRTIGYVVPREGVDLLTKMGKVVGIMGDAKMDPALGLNIVAPTRVDELQVAGGRFEVVPGSTSPAPSLSPTPGTPAGAPGAMGKPGENAPTPPKEQPVATPGTDPGELNK